MPGERPPESPEKMASRAPTQNPVGGPRRPPRSRLWGVISLGLLALGVVGSFAGADMIAQRDADRAQAEFERSSSDVVSALQLAIQRQEDLVVNASGLIASDPTISEAEFGEWAALTKVFDRYPEVEGFGFVVIVPLGELDTFVEQARLERGAQFPADGSFALVPPGDRPFYGLTKLQLSRDGELTPVGTDWFAASGLSLDTRDSGVSTYTPITIGADEFLSVHVPVYRAGVPLLSLEDRRQAFIGWVGTVSTPQLVLQQAVRAHPGLVVSMQYADDTSNVEFASGPIPVGSEVASVDVDGGWTIRTFADVETATLLGHRESRSALIALVLLSVAVAALVFVLGTGRARAVRLVAERTGELHHRALHDELTGLPNRALIIDRLDQLLARNRRRGSDPSALFIDIDDFKNVNDTLGHQAGDQLLRDVTARLTSTLRTADTLGRMGGDEFVVLIDGDRAVDGFSTPRSPELVAERLLAVMREPFELDGASAPLVVNTSIGIATGDRNSGDELLRDADVALYEAKAAGKNRFEVFDPEMERDMARRVELEFGLREAMDSHHFWLAYQPIYHLDDLSLVGVEALVRWSHPTLGTIGPDEFLPVLEQTGQIHEFGRWVLHEACRQMAEWHERGDTLDLSVNVSGRQLEHDVIVDHVRSALCDSGLAATSLTIEVSETDLMRNTNAVAVRLHAIHELGVRIAVDDFGTGYFSLAYLQHFPVDCLKIDRAFTNAITTSSESKTLIRTLVQLGTDLGLTTLAEGVETSDQMDHLRIANVNDAQGFLFSRPLAARAFEMQLLFPMRRQNSASKPDPRI
jgi:diguanylate cyclase (GGDEF)-like protein